MYIFLELVEQRVLSLCVMWKLECGFPAPPTVCGDLIEFESSN